MDESYPRWARDELTTLARRYGEPLIGVNRDPYAAAYLRNCGTGAPSKNFCSISTEI